MNNTKVLIIGAGPVGLTLACELARRDIPFRIIERCAVAPQGSRAKALQPRSLEILNDLGIAEDLMKIGSTELPYRKFQGNKMIGETPRTGFPRNDTRYPKTLLIPQPEVEKALRIKLQELGGSIEWATTLTDFKQSNNGINCQLENDRQHEAMHCSYMVACDGGKSSTRKKLGIDFVGETHQEEQLWVGDVEVAGLERDAWYNWLSPVFGIAFALFPFRNSNIWQLQAVMPADQDGNIPAPTLEGFNQLFKERTQMEGVRLTNSSWQSIYRVNIRRAERYRAGNAFIAGDAGHVHSIAGGMGMNTGIQDACNLGWKLAAVINGHADDRLLNTYGEERIPIADWLLATTSQRQKVMLDGAKTGKSGFETLGTNDTTQLNLNYRGSSLSKTGQSTINGLEAGDRAPDVQLTDGSWLSDQLRGTEWKLLLPGEEKLTALTDLVKVINTSDEHIREAYGGGEAAILIRPDGYIALIAASVQEVTKYLKQLNGL
ncbi:FAD-dependent monooxygenase [Chitinophaga pinensis]|uniref:FAD-dependent monooxygenase n=1 Tax=Chitinophaga pinensis TaxID=79329 RepID=UPI00164772E1|nr:FAD-dependent monooxygenase [Chitinophaga pinensis]